jgi:hypothetical protein
LQPIVAKRILPWFGGAPAVWTTSMLFFQVLLLAGYAYAHAIARKLLAKPQVLLHALLLLGSLCVLCGQGVVWQAPAFPSAGWKPPDSSMPIARILGLLIVSIGLPFFLLSASSPILQAWFTRRHPGRSPYRLYAVSNVGSLLGLISYPFLVEPALPLRTQAMVWSGCYVGFALLSMWCALRSLKAHPADIDAVEAAGIGQSPSAADEGASPPTLGLRIFWVFLAACPSLLLLATTSKISEDVAAIPLLWVLPLSIYLISFVICFGSQFYSRWRSVIAGLVAIAALCMVMYPNLYNRHVGVLQGIAIYLYVLFVCCMICHGELANLKPPSRHLTSFYLSVAAGGALGGAFAGLAAPYLFRGLWELYIGYAGCAGLLVAAMVRDRNSALHGEQRFASWSLAAAVVLFLVGGSLLMITWKHDTTARESRNFYGILRVTDEQYTEGTAPAEVTVLRHGGTSHGFQLQGQSLRRQPTCYYTAGSGAGLAIQNHPRRVSAGPGGGTLRIGGIGLGIGTIAAYGQPGDYFRFYEINPAVVELATGRYGYFTFLQDSPAKIDIVLGDARISMENELRQEQPQQFDVLVLDAFTDDAVPVHLLTRQAFEIYLAHMREPGIIAIHVSSRNIALSPAVWRLAESLSLHGMEIRTAASTDPYASASEWILLARDEAALRADAFARAARPRDDLHKFVSVWTDDYSNLFQLLRRKDSLPFLKLFGRRR